MRSCAANRVLNSAVVGCALVLASLAGEARAQWSIDAASPLRVAEGSGEQVIPKIARTADGGAYVAWFDNANSAGYDVRLQRLDALGNAQWAAGGILVIDCNFTSTQDYDLEVDQAGNAVVSSRDNVVVDGVTRIVVQKVDPAGNKLWGSTGTIVSSGTSNVSNPKLAILSDGATGVAWAQDSTIVMSRVDSAGVAQVTRTIVEAGRPMSISDACAGPDGSMIVMWVRASGTGFSANRWLYAQRYSAGLIEQWPSTVAAPANAVGVFVNTINAAGASVAGSLQIAYFPTIRPDGQGGFVAGWYENGSRRQAYIQHVLNDGTLRFAAPGLSSNTLSTRISVGMGFDYDVANDRYLLAWSESNASPQGNYSLGAQRFDATGAAAWPGNVNIINPGDATTVSFVNPLIGPSGAFVFGFQWTDPSGSLDATVRGACLADDGSLTWSKNVNTSSGAKSRMVSTLSSAGKPLIAYGVGGAGTTDIAAQRVLPDGTLGFCLADVGSSGGGQQPDDLLDNNDFVVFINYFFENDPRADLGGEGGVAQSDGLFDNNDFIVYIGSFFQGCL
jgi:hypothetical protein